MEPEILNSDWRQYHEINQMIPCNYETSHKTSNFLLFEGLSYCLTTTSQMHGALNPYKCWTFYQRVLVLCCPRRFVKGWKVQMSIQMSIWMVHWGDSGVEGNEGLNFNADDTVGKALGLVTQVHFSICLCWSDILLYMQIWMSPQVCVFFQQCCEQVNVRELRLKLWIQTCWCATN